MSDITIAVSEKSFIALFEALRDAFAWSDSKSGSFGPFTAGYDIAMHLDGGTVDLRSDGSVSIKELDVKWDKLDFSLGFDIPEICVGGFCIIPNPFGGCLLRAPKLCAFSGSPDVEITLPLAGILTSEISVTAKPLVNHAVDPGRTASMNDWDAHDAGVPDKWQVFLDPQTVDLDLFDLADIVGDLLMDAVDAVVDGLLGFLPGRARTLIKWLLGSVVDLVRAILDLPDDIAEWISDLLGVSLGLFNTLVTIVADFFAKKFPIYELEDPYPILAAESGKIPVLLPVENLAVTVSDKEMAVTGDVG